jgi:glycosyltransferase involved in cell wall biosynthesis
VICLDLGGPAQQISEETGIKVPAMNPEQTTRDLASAMRQLAEDPELRARMADAGIQSVRQSCSWEYKGRFWARLYEEVSNRR